jgi:uncharacterized protein YdeI (BOF family)
MKWIYESSKSTKNTLNVRRLTMLASASALVAPIASALVSPATAQPPAHAPAWGYRRGDRPERSRDNDRDSNYGAGRRNRQAQTLTGVVTRDVAGDRFEMRSEAGRTFTVRLRQQDEPQRLNAGDRVRVTGFFRRDDSVFVAERVRIISNTPGSGVGYGDTRRVNFPGTVINRRDSRSVTVRGDNGRTYVVDTRSNLSRIDDGDRVRVVGDARGTRITNATVALLRNTDRPGVGEGQRIEFLGTVARVDTARDEIVVREDATGRTSVFRPREADDFRVGQRVRATGRIENGRIVLSRVVRL